MKKVLLLCASHNDLGLIRGLKKCGYDILAIGNTPGQPGEELVDRYIQMDYSDKEQVLSLALEEKIDAICQCCNDFGVYTSAYVAEKLGLPGYDSYDNTLILHNKDKFKLFAVENGIPIPEFQSFSCERTAIEWLKEHSDRTWIVKPSDASAGNGVAKLDFLGGIEAAVKAAFSKSREKRIIVERYIEGNQHGFCTFLINRKVVALSTNDEYSILNPYRIEIDTFPASEGKEITDMLIREIEKIADILQLKDGIFHLQYIMDRGEPKIIEVMRRILGNMYSVPANRLCGIDWDYWEVRAKCGLSLDDFPAGIRQEGYYAYKTILAQKNGYIRNISIPAEYERHIYDKFMLRNRGDEITDYLNQPIGFLFLTFKSQREMHKMLIDEYRNDFVRE